jgi:hypothetical protein
MGLLPEIVDRDDSEDDELTGELSLLPKRNQPII